MIEIKRVEINGKKGAMAPTHSGLFKVVFDDGTIAFVSREPKEKS